MNEETRIWKEKGKKGKELYCVVACGKYGEFETQLEAANFADAILSVANKKEGQ